MPTRVTHCRPMATGTHTTRQFGPWCSVIMNSTITGIAKMNSKNFEPTVRSTQISRGTSTERTRRASPAIARGAALITDAAHIQGSRATSRNTR